MKIALICNVSLLILFVACDDKKMPNNYGLEKLGEHQRFIMFKEAVNKGQLDIAYDPDTNQYHLVNLSGPIIRYCPFTGFLLDTKAQVRDQDMNYDPVLSDEIQKVIDKLAGCNNLQEVVAILGNPDGTSNQGNRESYIYINLISDRSIEFEISDDNKPGVIIRINKV